MFNRHFTPTVHMRAFLLGSVLFLAQTPCVVAQTLTQPATQPRFKPATAPAVTKPVQKEGLPTPEEIIAKSIEAMGGQEEFDAVESMHVVGTLQSTDTTASMDLKIQPNGDAILVSQSYDGQDIFTMGCDGEIGWLTAQQTGNTYQLIDLALVSEMRDQVSMHDVIGMIQKQYKDMATVDTVTIDNKRCYKIGLVSVDPTVTELHYAMFDQKSNLFVSLDMHHPGHELGHPKTTFTIKVTEWQSVHKLKFPKTLTLLQLGQTMLMRFDHIAINKLDPAVFELPKAVKELVEEAKEHDTPATQPTKD